MSQFTNYPRLREEYTKGRCLSVSIFPPLCLRRSGVMGTNYTTNSQPGRASELLVVLHIVPHSPGERAWRVTQGFGLGSLPPPRGTATSCTVTFPVNLFPPACELLEQSWMFLALALAGVEQRSLVCCMCGRDRGLQKGSGSPGPVSDPACVGGIAGTQGATPGGSAKSFFPLPPCQSGWTLRRTF